MRYTCAVLGIAALCLAATLVAGKEKNPDDETQTLALPKDPPAVAVGETRHLLFYRVASFRQRAADPADTRRLESDSEGKRRRARGAHPGIRGGQRRHSEGAANRQRSVHGKKTPLPSVSVIRAGGLPVENAQVVLEAVSVAKKETNSGGVQFVAGDEAVDKDPSASVKPLLDKALAQLSSKTGGAAAFR